MDRATVVGLTVTIALLVWVMVAGAGLAIHAFWQTTSLALVVGGALLSTVVAFPEARLRTIWGVLKNAVYVRTRPPEESIVTLVALAEIARREGLLALDRPVQGLRDEFLRRAMQMAIDGYEPATIRAMMQAELESTDLRHSRGRGMLEAMGRSAPVFGMIGTLIGLVAMFGHMDEPSRIGAGMAVAMLTTLYGLIVAHVFCWPLARRLGYRSSEELIGKTIVLEGVLAIQAGDHPRILAQRLRAYLPAEQWGGLMSRPAAGGPASETDPEASRPGAREPAATGEARRPMMNAA